MRRVALAILAVFMTSATLSVAHAAPAAATITRSNITVFPMSLCGNVRLSMGPSGTADQIIPRLPIRVYATAIDRGLARTLVRTISALPANAEFTQNLFTSAPDGVGPGVQVDVEWTGGTDSFVSEPYVDQCPGTLIS